LLTRRVELSIHPGQTCLALPRIEVGLTISAQAEWELCYHLSGRIGDLAIPEPAPPVTTDGLWQHTCCELFVAVRGEEGYREFNFSPSGAWAHYAFSAYRQRIPWPGDLPAPVITTRRRDDELTVQVRLAPAFLPQAAALQVGLTAVVEDRHGACTHWALAHQGERPDFHQRSTFLLDLP